ncbi:SDR family NAD(P)-dependent oxidoreductase [Streptomyces sp. NPDC002092]
MAAAASSRGTTPAPPAAEQVGPDDRQGHREAAPGGHAGAPPVAVVTGANRGIGYEVVRQLAARGHHVVLGSRDLAEGRSAAARIDPGGERVSAVQLDVSDAASVAAMADRVGDTLGRVDVVVNNAAILYDTWAQARSADLGEVQRALDTNLFGDDGGPPARTKLRVGEGHPGAAAAAAAQPAPAGGHGEQRGRFAAVDERRHPRLQRLQGRAQRPDLLAGR